MSNIWTTPMPDFVQECTGETLWTNCFNLETESFVENCGLEEGGRCSELAFMESFMKWIEELSIKEVYPPAWTIPISMALALVVGYVLTYYFEKPMQRVLRS